jgi:uncharacterized membrane protein YcaP (DUF421 family)
MDNIFGEVSGIGWISIQALLLYLTAIIGFRLGKRRTLAEMSPFDFIAAVAVGAIVGRVPNAEDAAYLAGAVTLVTILIAHRIITELRHFPSIGDLVNPSSRLLVSDGEVLRDELRRSGLTQSDLYGLLRQRGYGDLSEVRYVIFEQRGQVSIVPRAEHEGPEPQLIREVTERG